MFSQAAEQPKVIQNIATSVNSLILVLLKNSKILNDMAKVQLKSEKFTPSGVFFFNHRVFSLFFCFYCFIPK